MNYRNLQTNDIKSLVDFWNNNIEIYKPFTEEAFINHVIKHSDFSYEGAFLCVEDEKIIGFANAINRAYEANDDTKPGYLTTLLVDKKYRHQGIATNLIKLCEEYIKSLGKKSIAVSYRSTLNYPWYIPNTDHHDHAGAPGAIVNSDLYLFLINHDYIIKLEADAFHQDLAKYNMPEKVKAKLEKNKKNGYVIEVFDPEKHYGIDEFCDDIKDEGFIRVIKGNLALEKPFPFLVVNKDGKILGWTGAMYTEPSGRAHFDGICIGTSIRGLGLGQGLWCSLAEYSKLHGSKFMTFFTGRTNIARYIYIKSGFKIVQSFAIMEKEI